jgi:uncharacterized membrane protein
MSENQGKEVREMRGKMTELTKMTDEALTNAGWFFMIFVVCIVWVGNMQNNHAAIVACFTAWYFMSVAFMIMTFTWPTIEGTKLYKKVVLHE